VVGGGLGAGGISGEWLKGGVVEGNEELQQAWPMDGEERKREREGRVLVVTLRKRIE
jgi:hypothetical protein